MRSKPVFSPEIPKARAKKTGFNLIIVHFYIRRKLDIHDVRHSFFVWLRTGSNPADINLVRSFTGERELFQ